MRIITFIYQNTINYSFLEENTKITIGGGKKDDIRVEDLKNELFTVKWNKKGIFLSAKAPYQSLEQELIVERMIWLEQDMQLWITESKELTEQRIKLPYDCVLRVGREEAVNQVVLKQKYVSREHMVIKCEAGIVRIEDTNSLHGVYVNNKRIEKNKSKKLQPGDRISIVDIQITLKNGELIFQNAGQDIVIKEIGAASNTQTYSLRNDGKAPKFQRSPRMQKQLPDKEITLAAPPMKSGKFEKHKGVFSSLFGHGAMMAASMAVGTVSPAFMLARAAGMLPSLMSAKNHVSGDKKQKKKLEEYERLRELRYGQYIREQQALIETVANEQREIMNSENPSPKECMQIVKEVKHNLWERSRWERDFLDVRMGMSYEPLCVPVKSFSQGEGFHMENDEVRQLAEELIEQTRMVDFIPGRLQLSKYTTVGMLGDRQKVINEMRNLLISLSTLHFYRDVKIVGIFDEEEQEEWKPLRWLPHVWDDEHQRRYLAFNREEAHELCERMEEIIVSRKHKLSEEDKGKTIHQYPHYVIILGSKNYLKYETIMEKLTLNPPEIGVSSIFLFDDLYHTPNACEYFVDMNQDPSAYEKEKINQKLYFTIDNVVDKKEFDSFARMMSSIRLTGFAEKAEIPNSITFLQGYGIQRVEALNVEERWRVSRPDRTLTVPIGVMAGNKPLELDIFDYAKNSNAHGPHALMAGTSGAGKSELLQSWLLSLALNYHPQEVAFVIIDYKGGGMANLFDNLPHMVSKVTNIGGGIKRSLKSLEYEVKRRLAIFEKYSKECGKSITHIQDYLELYRKKIITEPLPHLIIVVDEFAELRKNEPDFMKGLIQVAGVGRSLGVNLVLATQEPSGQVDDLMDKNISIRLCLRVQDSAASRGILKTPDAAGITKTGRAYLKVRNFAVYELFQSYWSGALYSTNGKMEEQESSVQIVKTDGKRLKLAPVKRDDGIKKESELTAIVNYIADAAKRQGIKKLQGPVLPELTETVSLTQLEYPMAFDGEQWRESKKWMSLPIGIYDIPEQQQQGIQSLDLAEVGNTGIYGSAFTGKTTLLKTILLSVGLNYTPDEVQLYGIDCGSKSLTIFSEMPHVGGIALGEETEKIQKLEKMFLEELAFRKNLFLKHYIGSLQSYRETVSQDLPAWILVIDNITAMFNLYPELESSMNQLFSEGSAYGIYIIFTANTLSGVKYKIQQTVKNAIAFEMTDKGEYPALVGSLNGRVLGKTRGRAFVKGTYPVIFQSATYTDGQNEPEQVKNLLTLLRKMDGQWTGQRPKSIPIMPEIVSMKELHKWYTCRTSIPLGLAYEDIEMCYADLSEEYVFLVSGIAHSGKTRYLKRMIELICNQCSQNKVYIFDDATRELETYSEKVNGYGVYTSQQDVDRMQDAIVKLLNQRLQELKIAKENQGIAFDGKAFAKQYDQICIFIDDIKQFFDAVTNEQLDRMERICRLAKGIGVLVVVSGRTTDINNLNLMEKLTRQLVSYQQGIMVGGSASQCMFFQNDLNFTEKMADLEEGDAYLFEHGKCRKIKIPQD